MLRSVTLCGLYQFVSSFIRTFGLFSVFGPRQIKLLQMFACTLFCKRKFSFLLDKDAKSHIKYMFNYMRKCQIVFENFWTILYYQQQSMRAPIAPHPCWQWVLLAVSCKC